MGKRVGEGWAGEPPHGFEVEVKGRDYTVPPDLQVYIEKLKAKLAKFGRNVTHLVVWLKDLNGTKGGVDQACHVEATLAGLEPVNVEETQEDLRASIDLAVDRLEEVLRRHLGKRRTRSREMGRKMVRNRKLTST